MEKKKKTKLRKKTRRKMWNVCRPERARTARERRPRERFEGGPIIFYRSGLRGLKGGPDPFLARCGIPREREPIFLPLAFTSWAFSSRLQHKTGVHIYVLLSSLQNSVGGARVFFSRDVVGNRESALPRWKREPHEGLLEWG